MRKLFILALVCTPLFADGQSVPGVASVATNGDFIAATAVFTREVQTNPVNPVAVVPDALMATEAKTNSFGVVTTETFSREGRTNLVRQTTASGRTFTMKFQTFYQDESKVATAFFIQSSTTRISQFYTEPDTPYRVVLQFNPSNQVEFLTVYSNHTSVVGAFNCTNGIFYPRSGTVISALKAVFHKKVSQQSSPYHNLLY
jgi:hypothetical protein